MSVRYRRFVDTALQRVYDQLRKTPPNPADHGSFRIRGGISSAYVAGYEHPTIKSRYVRNSQAYAGWAAGVDNARLYQTDLQRPKT